MFSVKGLPSIKFWKPVVNDSVAYSVKGQLNHIKKI